MPQRIPAPAPIIALVMALIIAITTTACTGNSPEAVLQADYDRRIQWQGVTSQVCELASIQEISAILGTPVVDSRIMARDSGRCQWLARTTAGASLHIHDSPLPLHAGDVASHELLPDLGTGVFLVAFEGEFRGHATVSNRSVAVTSPDRDSTEAILRLILQRLAR